MPTETREGETTYYAGDDCPGGHAETAQMEQTPERALAAVIDARDREIAALNEQLEEAGAERDTLDDLAFERAGEIDDLKRQVADLEEKIRFAHQEADYGATHGHEAQDTLDYVLKVLR